MFPHMIGRSGPGAAVVVGGGTGTGDGGFVDQPVVTTTASGNTTIKGKVKAGSFGKFVFPLATIAAGRQYTFRYTPQFSQLAQQGKLAMVGFGLKNSNDFHIVGLRGDGSTGVHKYIVDGTPPNGWNAQTGHTVVDGGASAAGTQAGPNYIRLLTSADGTTYTYSDSNDGVTWSSEIAAQAPTPFANVSSVTTFGIALWFNNADAGPFSIVIDQFADAAAPVAPLDGLAPTGAYSLSRDLLTSFTGGSRYTGTTTASALNDQSGGSRNLSASPSAIAVTTDGPNSRTCAHLDNVNQDFTGSVMSNFIAAGAGYMIASFSLWATAGANNLVFGDGSTNLGLYLQAGKINSYNQGQWAPALGSGFATANSTPYVAEWRHEGGNLYCRLNGGSWSVATVSGNSTLTGALNIGGKGGSGQAPINFFEAATWSTVPSTANQDAVVADFKAWIGA